MPATSQTTYDVCTTIAQLFIYPIKSCAALPVTQAVVTPTGFAYDRNWLLVDEQGRFITQRELAKMVLIVPTIGEHDLIVNAPGMTTLIIPLAKAGADVVVQVFDDSPSAFDMGDEAAAWFTEFLGQVTRLVRFNTQVPRLCSTKWTGGVYASHQFSDGYPFLVTSVAAVDELNKKLQSQGFAAVDQRRFRPNIVLADVPAHEEDLLDVLAFEGDSMVALKIVKPCTRCTIPSVDPDVALYQPEMVGDTLQSYRSDARVDGAVSFGMNAIVQSGDGHVVRVGQEVCANYVF